MITKGNKRKVVDHADKIKKIKKMKLVTAKSSSENCSDLKATHESSIKSIKKKSKKLKKKEITKMADFQDIEGFDEAQDLEEVDIEEDPSNEKICADDPFFAHFNRNIPEDRISVLDDTSNWSRQYVSWPQAGKMEVKLPVVDQSLPVDVKRLLDDDEDQPTPLPPIGIIPEPCTKAFDAISNGFVDEKLVKNINPKAFSAFQSEIFTLISNYIDFWHNEASQDKWEKIKRVYALHCLNHILKAKNQILRNNKQLKSVKEDECPPPLTDQGFTRPRVLILLPFRHSAYRLIKIMISLLGMEVMNRKKFETEFGANEENDTTKDKPEDFFKIFGNNKCEDFKIGITVTKNNVQLFASFHKCDMIIASPLAMRQMLEIAKTNGEKNILSSIEVFLMDQADIFVMQSWQHIVIIRENMNVCPVDYHSMDFDIYRIHKWHYNNQSHHYVQTIVFSSTSCNQIRGVMGSTRNFAGKVMLRHNQQGVLPSIKVQADLTMIRFNKNDPDLDECAARFKYFTKELLPTLRKDARSHIMIYIPDYIDYLNLVSYFKQDGGTSVATINEYMIKENDKVAKARSLFFEGKRPILLYTERFHFYRRYKIKGVRHVVFYAPPTYPHLLTEICQFLGPEYQNRKEPFTGLSTIYLPFQETDLGKMIDLVGTTKMKEIEKTGKKFHSYFTGINL